jgi:hypothetical protein
MRCSVNADECESVFYICMYCCCCWWYVCPLGHYFIISQLVDHSLIFASPQILFSIILCIFYYTWKSYCFTTSNFFSISFPHSIWIVCLSLLLFSFTLLQCLMSVAKWWGRGCGVLGLFPVPHSNGKMSMPQAFEIRAYMWQHTVFHMPLYVIFNFKCSLCIWLHILFHMPLYIFSF